MMKLHVFWVFLQVYIHFFIRLSEKSKLKSADVPETPVQDAMATQTLQTPSSDTPNKKVSQ